MPGVMSGIRILEVAEHTFVPVAAAVLSDWGADVVKVEHVERGDAMRGLTLSGQWTLNPDTHVLLEHSNRGKRSIAVDLSVPEGREIVYALAARCDVFLTNKAPSVRRKLRIDVEDIRAHNPRIVYVRGSAWGARGPDADRGGYDYTSYWCRSGNAMGASREGSDPLPMMPAPAYGDSIGGMMIAGGIAAALLQRERTGEAPVVDVSLLAAGLWSMAAGISMSDQVGQPWRMPPPDDVGHPLSHTYRTADGRALCLSMLQGAAYWERFCRKVGLDGLATDPRFSTAEAYAAHSAEGIRLLAEFLATADLDEWCRRLDGFAGQWSTVLDTLDAMRDEQVQANGYVVDMVSRSGGAYKLVSAPVQFDEVVPQPRRAPAFNEHGDEILQQDLGLDWERIVELKVKGVVA